MGLGRQFASVLSETIAALPNQPRWPQQLCQRLGLTKDVASRLWRASRGGDPLATMLTLPGPAPLRQFLRAAERNSVPAEFVSRTSQLIDEFEMLIRAEFGERACMDALIASLLPEARDKHLLLHRQSAFRSMAQIKGSCTEVMVNIAVILPSAAPEYVDGVWVLGWFGLRRIRPEVAVRFSTGRIGELAATDPTTTLDGAPIDGCRGLLLDSFCSPSSTPVQTVHAGNAVHYVLGGSHVGRTTAVDVVMAMRTPRCLQRGDSLGKRRLQGPTMEIATPCRLALFDVFVAKELDWQAPRLRVYDTAVYGVADMNDPAREIDRLDLNESVQELGGRIHVAELPRYVEMVAEVLRRTGRELHEFEVFRCRSKYPVYGAQFSMAFRVW